MTEFTSLPLRDPILRAVAETGYSYMTPIQKQAIPILLDGNDLIGIAQTGTGKTAAFSLPLLQRLLKGEGQRRKKSTRALILAPTRELALQIGENIRIYSKYLHLKHTLVFGGVSDKPQIKALESGVDILVATPGRLLDLLSQKYIHLQDIEHFILDEADRMLDMGFIRDIRKIVKFLPDHRQTVLFSATMPQSVEALANNLLTDPQRIEIAPPASTAEKIDQYILMVPKSRKRELLAHILKDSAIKRTLVFTRTKHGANRVAKYLDQLGIVCRAIHGNKSQNARQKALKEFRDGHIRALVATDVAARGIDVDGVTHVINFDLPDAAENYIHRIGRTARAGAKGISLSFCDHDERSDLKQIEKTIRRPIPRMEDHPFHAEGITPRQPEGNDRENPRPAESRRRAGNGKNKPDRRGNHPKPHAPGKGSEPQDKKRPKRRRRPSRAAADG